MVVDEQVHHFSFLLFATLHIVFLFIMFGYRGYFFSVALVNHVELFVVLSATPFSTLEGRLFRACDQSNRYDTLRRCFDDGVDVR